MTELEQYIEQEVNQRIHAWKISDVYQELKQLDKKTDESINRLYKKIDEQSLFFDHKIETKFNQLENKTDRLNQKIDTKFTSLYLMMLGTIIVPVILHFLKLT